MIKAAMCVVVPIFLLASGCGRSLERQVQDSVRTFDHVLLNREDVEVLSVQESGGLAIAEVQIRTAVKMRRVDGRWELDEIRLGDRRWDKAEHFAAALNQNRRESTQGKLREIDEAIRRYADRHGTVPQSESFEALIDILTPGYLPRLIRIDAWSNPIRYLLHSAQRYELRSAGSDGRFETSDDIVLVGEL